MLLMPLMAGAQALKGSYFLDNSLNRNKMNPAFAPRADYLQIPAVGNFSVGALTNMDMQTFLYPIDGQLYTFLNKNVSADRFEAALARKPYIDISADLNLINFGWKWGKGYWTFDTGVRTNADVDIPRDLFTFMKRGSVDSGVYGIGSVRMNASVSLYAALGYSRDLSDLVPGLRIGAKVRGVVPAAYADVDLYDVNLSTSPDKWTLNANVMAHTSLHGLELLDAEGNFSPGFPGGMKIAPAGWGLSFDLGAEYSLKFDGFINGVSFSASFTDLGFVKYSAEATGKYTSEGQMDWTGVKVAVVDGAVDQEALNSALDELKGEFQNLLNVKKAGGGHPITRSTLPSFYVGAEMPFCNNLMSIGALYSSRRSQFSSRHELTVSYNLNPAKWFAMGVNYSFLNVTKTMGFMLEFTPKAGPCLCVGVDYIPWEYVKAPKGMALPYLPTAARLNAHVGLAFALGAGK